MILFEYFHKDEAEQLYKSCNRYDLLNLFYQASNNWAQVSLSYLTIERELPAFSSKKVLLNLLYF